MESHLSMAHCTVNVTEANWTTCTRQHFCLPGSSEKRHVQLSGPTTAPGCPCHPCPSHLHSGGKKPAYCGDMEGFEMMQCKHWVNVYDSWITKSKEHLTFLCLHKGWKGREWLRSRHELLLLILLVLKILPHELRTKESNIHICLQCSNQPLCNVFVATGQYPSDTLPPDTLLIDTGRVGR